MNKINNPVDIIQSCRPNFQELNEFSKELFADRINKMNSEEFNSFCKYILHLREFYDWNSNCWLTDKDEAIIGKEEYFWKVAPIDFDAPINFQVFSRDADTNNFEEN